MNRTDRFDQVVSDWLHQDAEHRVPEHLDAVLRRTSTERQRPAWSSLERWLPVQTTLRLSPVPRAAWVLAVLGLVLAIGAGLLWAGTRQRLPAPFGPARNGELLSWHDGDIYAADSEMAVGRPIIPGPTNDLAPLVTRDGMRLAFFRLLDQHTAHLMIANIDGTHVRQVLADPLTDSDWFEWSAQDDRLAIVSTMDGLRALSVVDVAAGKLTTLSVDGLQVDNDVYWMPPNGDRLIFTARPEPGQDGPVSIYTIHPDGTDLQRLASVRAEVASYNGLQVSQDGRTIGYWNYEPDDSPDGMGSHIHMLDVMSGADRVTTFDPTAEGETDVVFSPDGRHAVAQREEAQQAQLLIATLDGSRPPKLVGPKFGIDVDAGYGFSPDGTRIFIAFENQRPVYIDVATGDESIGPETVEGFAGYQRLAQ